MPDKKIKLVSPDGDEITCRIADTFRARFNGFMGVERPADKTGIVIKPCNSIHMFFMKFALDILFLDNDYRIVKLIRNLAPWRIVGTVSGATQVAEIPAGDLPSSFTESAHLKAIEL